MEANTRLVTMHESIASSPFVVFHDILVANSLSLWRKIVRRYVVADQSALNQSWGIVRIHFYSNENKK